MSPWQTELNQLTEAAARVGKSASALSMTMRKAFEQHRISQLSKPKSRFHK